MDVDPVASMRCWAIEVELGGHIYEVPPLPAADWWPVLVAGDKSALLDLLTSTPDDDLDELLLTGEITGEDLTTVYIDTIEEVTGRSFQAAYVLAAVAQLQWPVIGGQLAERGFRWDVMPIGSALDAIYSIAVNGMAEEKDRKKFLALLDKPMPGRGRPIDRDKMISDFEAMAGPKPSGGVRSTGAPSDSARPRTPRQRQPRRPAAP